MNSIKREDLQEYCALLTQPSETADSIANPLNSQGMQVVALPCLEFLSVPESIERILQTYEESKWFVFTSANGVRKSLDGQGVRNVLLNHNRLACIGKRTSDAARLQGLSVSFVPSEQNSLGFAMEFPKFLSGKDREVVLLRGNLANKFLPEKLSSSGLSVEEIVAYETVCPSYSAFELELKFSKLFSFTKSILIFSSGQAARNLAELSRKLDFFERLKQIPVAVIGPETRKVVEELDFSVFLEATKPDLSLMANEILTNLREI